MDKKIEELKVAIVHDWLVTYGGAERVVETMCEIFPQADIYTLIYDEEKMGHIFSKEKVKTTFIQKFPKATKLYTKMLPLMPRAFEELDLEDYDMVLSSSSCCAKGVITSPSTIHIAYIHSPMRYAWDLYYDYRNKSGYFTKLFMSLFMPSIRQWDVISSTRIDKVLANSNYISKRIKKYWGRDSEVVYPPIEVERLEANGKKAENFYVAFSRFVPYKRIDLAVKACTELKKNLVVIGDGEQREYLKSIAGETVIFTGRLSDEKVKDYLQRCKAMIFCAEEDFGIVPLEVQACGRPVIAYGKGGSLETVVEDVTGTFFNEQTVESVKSQILKFEKMVFNTDKIVEHAKSFSKDRFKKEIKEIALEAINYSKSLKSRHEII